MFEQLFHKFPRFLQYDEMDCGPSCLHIICKHYGKDIPLDHLRTLCDTKRTGSSMLGIKEAAEKLGFEASAVTIGYDDANDKEYFPFIAYWNQKHYVVVYKMTDKKVYVSDPAYGLLTYKRSEFEKSWKGAAETGVALLLAPQENFFSPSGEYYEHKKGIGWILRFYRGFGSVLTKIIILLIIGSAIQFVFPFLTQFIVDKGIDKKNLSMINMLLLGQLTLFAGRIFTDVFRNYLLLKLSTRININMVNAFFKKLMRLPSGFFDTKMTGDILQRISDHQRIESFLSTGTLNFLFALVSVLVFGVVLAWYNWFVFAVFLTGTIIYFLWFWFFMKRRAALDYKRFSSLAENQEKNIELIFGMQEIKLNNAEEGKRNQWLHLQEKLFGINQKSLALRQTQTAGASLINELKNILITFLAARLVIQSGGAFTLGNMLAISYITGQLNGPVSQILEFFQNYQDAALSLNRINEIHSKKDETDMAPHLPQHIPHPCDIEIKNLCFKYINSNQVPYVLNNVNFKIPYGKTTAIVGSSGSGKTTLLKLLLRYYQPQEGGILLNDLPLDAVSFEEWRNYCGAVLQEGFIFSESIRNNIVLDGSSTNEARLKQTLQVTNLEEFIANLPMGLNTKIGQNGIGISAGQRQRILIARAVYKTPAFILFDEATSALDAKNEKDVWDKLSLHFKNHTALVIAHRLSTVKNADNIIVLENGVVAEQGTHEQLSALKGIYFNLVKNQLELGN